MMPDVKKCTVSECFYNMNSLCHANAIQVGSDHAMCDTFIQTHNHDEPANKGKVGACHMGNCEYNEQLSCHANGIDVGHHQGHADCFTFEPK